MKPPLLLLLAFAMAPWSMNAQNGVLVVLSPKTATVTAGGTQKFTAEVQNSDKTAIFWAASAGTIDVHGLFRAPIVATTTIVAVTATSQANAAKTSTAIVTVKPLRSSAAIPSDYFGHHMNGLVRWGTTYPSTFQVYTDRCWNCGVEWPLPGSHGEQILDETLARMAPYGIKMLLTLQRYYPNNVPLLSDWLRLVDYVMTKYEGKVEAIEIANEPDTTPTFIPVNTLVQMAKIAYELKVQHNSSMLLVGPGTQAHPAFDMYFAKFLAAGGGQYLDVLSHHFYQHQLPPEAMLGRVATQKAVMASYGMQKKPLWNTEFNNIEQFNLTQQQQIAYIERTHIIGLLAGLNRFYWYGTDATAGVGVSMYSPQGWTIVAQAYGQLQQLLVGATLGTPGVDGNGIETLPLMDKNGGFHVVTWNTMKSDSVPTWN